MSERPHCFYRGGFDDEIGAAIVQFSDGSIYRYPDFTAEEWIEWRDATPRGVFFNETYRWTRWNFWKLKNWPDNLTLEFYDPDGEP